MKAYKGRPLLQRAGFAASGLAAAFRSERSFRTQCLAAGTAAALTAWLRPGWIWAGMMAVAIGMVLAAELVNTALEHALDGLHQEEARFVAIAKDCAAAAVLVSSALSVVLFVFMLLDTGRWSALS